MSPNEALTLQGWLWRAQPRGRGRGALTGNVNHGAKQEAAPQAGSKVAVPEGLQGPGTDPLPQPLGPACVCFGSPTLPVSL